MTSDAHHRLPFASTPAGDDMSPVRAGLSPFQLTEAGFRVLTPEPVDPLTRREEPPTFSIAIAAYQAAATIGEAVRSAVEQSFPALEVIVVDDGSTDNLEGALRLVRDRIQLIRKENGGAASARNAAVRAASGEFLAILDADDRYHPRRLEALADLILLRPDLDLVTTDARFVVDDEPVGRFAAENPFAVRDQRRAIFENCFVGGWPAVRLDRLRRIGGFDETLGSAVDWDCWLRLILDGARAGLVDEPYYDYVLRPGTLSASRVAALWSRVLLLEKAWSNPSLSADERPALVTALRHHRTQAAVHEIKEALAAGGNEHRRRLLELALCEDVTMHARALATFAATAPSFARRCVKRDLPPHMRFRASRP